jgi:hypothetical protein
MWNQELGDRGEDTEYRSQDCRSQDFRDGIQEQGISFRIFI